jgi:hypothetical protein
MGRRLLRCAISRSYQGDRCQHSRGQRAMRVQASEERCRVCRARVDSVPPGKCGTDEDGVRAHIRSCKAQRQDSDTPPGCSWHQASSRAGSQRSTLHADCDGRYTMVRVLHLGGEADGPRDCRASHVAGERGASIDKSTTLKSRLRQRQLRQRSGMPMRKGHLRQTEPSQLCDILRQQPFLPWGALEGQRRASTGKPRGQGRTWPSLAQPVKPRQDHFFLAAYRSRTGHSPIIDATDPTMPTETIRCWYRSKRFALPFRIAAPGSHDDEDSATPNHIRAKAIAAPKRQLKYNSPRALIRRTPNAIKRMPIGEAPRTRRADCPPRRVLCSSRPTRTSSTKP